MVPNEVVKVTETNEKTLKGSFEYEKEITDPEFLCQSELKNIKTTYTSNSPDYREQLYELYNKYKNNSSKDYSQLLDVNNPSCAAIESTVDKSCGSTTVIKKWIDKTTLDDNYLYCTASYSLNSSLFLSSISQPNNLLYASSDGNVASANISITCNAVKKTSNTNIDFNIKSPTIILLAFGATDKTDNVEFESSFVNNSQNCTLDGDGIYNCSGNIDKNTSELIFNINGIITYKYPEVNNLGLKKGKLSNDSVVTDADTNCKNNCLKLGYGIYVPSDILVDGDSVIKFDFTDTSFNVKNSETQEYIYNQECPYQINNIKEKNEVLYRNISTTSPFLSLTGSERYTGTNWCNFETDEQDATEDSIEVEEITPSCFYPGDVNQNGTWDDEDYTILKDVIYNNAEYDYNLKNLYDANIDSIINDEDLVAVDSFLSNGDYPKYDINLDGIFDNNDVTLLGRVLLDSDSITGFQTKQADSNNDCKITLVDLTVIMRQLENLDEDESTTDNSEEINAEDVNSSSEVVTPSEADETIDSQDTSWISFGNNYDSTFSCNANNAVVEKYIKNRPTANGVIKITTNGTTETKKVKPLYSFTLTPDNIKEIREYNATTTYDDFNLTCTNGKECISNFVTDILLDNSYATFNAENSLCGSDKFCNVSEVIDSEVNK